MNNNTEREIVFQKLGEVSALFMSQEVQGTEIVMPTEELEKIGNELVSLLTKAREEEREKVKQEVVNAHLNFINSVLLSDKQ